MKKTISFALLALTTSFGYSQANCSKFYPLEKGTTFQYKSSDDKGKPEGTVDYTISEVSDTGSATQATLDLKYTDKKGKDVFDSNYKITCENGVVKIDYKSLFPTQMVQQYSEMDIEMDVTGTDIELPNDLSVGQELADANVSIDMKMGGMTMNTTVDQTNRKVEKKESITTPAGTYDCYLITETTTSKTMGASFELNSKLWLAEGVGMVKQESYKKNGKLMTSTELTKFSK
ncbi:hypothetical protein LCGC14_1473600 [marine sediment metagenome]|uniref:DUF3108 domain-containing protein n=2 Tax=root TaxID=1 RepID=A0A831QMU0_9FLAO|nr:hypothetical protein [Pricia antarctica]